jgi:hypothetical protein
MLWMKKCERAVNSTRPGCAGSSVQAVRDSGCGTGGVMAIISYFS